ncbi:MAG: oligoendopeptidase F [Erysipelotrichia bacterium]|nr:oligoendopeptidase F [Erysipelotrichia bacterium]NCC53971.1 oligoendopeptidase F [Erysipelotrichia bacterium]
MKEKLRKEVAIKDTWATEDIFASEQDWQNALSKVEKQCEKLQQYQGKLHNAQNLLAYLQEEEVLSKQLDDVCGYASLRSDEDTSDAHCQSLEDQAMGMAVFVGQKLSFAEVEILQLSDEEIERFYKEEKALLVYQRLLTKLRLNKGHILSENEERLLAGAQEMANAPVMIHSMMCNADMQFDDAIDAQGNTHHVSNGTFVSLLQSSDRSLRISAFKQYYQQYVNLKNTSAAILASQMKKLKFYANARKFNSTLEAALHFTQVPQKVYHNLIEAVHEDIHILHKYMRLRKKVMGVEKLHMYDLYVPIVDGCDMHISIEEAKQNVLASTALLKEEYQTTLEKAFNERWIDVYENKGKRSGAYSSGQNVHPFVLLNYHHTLDSEFTLAHEMGHAMHSYLSTKYQPYADHRYVIFVAEVASTCNEALLMHYLREHTQDKKVQAYLINYFLEQFRTTLYRQCMFAEFEWKVNTMIENKETLSADTLSKLYHELNVFYYGEDVEVDELIDIEWSRIPHFYMNYYVYQYATGFSAAMALSKKLIAQEEGAVENYLSFLKGGCSKTPIALLKEAGVDMESVQPIHDALALFDQLIDELDTLLDEIKHN